MKNTNDNCNVGVLRQKSLHNFSGSMIWFFALLIFIISGFLPFKLYAEAESIKWLTVSDQHKKNWEVIYDSKNPSIMHINAKWDKRYSDIEKKIVALVPKKSSSYILATDRLLQVFNSKGIYASITIFDFGNDMKKGVAILEKAEEAKADLIFSMGSESAALVHENYRDREIPVVTCTNKDPVLLGQVNSYRKGSGSNIATTSLNVPLDIQLKYLFELIPDLKNIALMYNKNHKQVMATEVIPAKKEFTQKNLKVIDVAVESSEDSKKTLEKIVPEAVREMRKNDPGLEKSVFWITSSTAVFSEIETINRFSDKVPVIGSIPNIVKKGDISAVLAIGIDRRNNAFLASIYAVSILKGEAKPGDLPVGIVTPPDIAINFRIAKKIGLKIPFTFFESASFIYDYDGNLVRSFGEKVVK